MATPLVAKRILIVCKIMRKWSYLSLDYHLSEMFPDIFIVSESKSKIWGFQSDHPPDLHPLVQIWSCLAPKSKMAALMPHLMLQNVVHRPKSDVTAEAPQTLLNITRSKTLKTWPHPSTFLSVFKSSGGCLTRKTTTPMIPRCLHLLLPLTGRLCFHPQLIVSRTTWKLLN